MSVRTAADEHLDDARELVKKARKALACIVIDECWGTKDLTSSLRCSCDTAMGLLTQALHFLSPNG